jgi:hypothetical protein
MDVTTAVLSIVSVAAFVAYMLRRRARLNSEE